MKQNITIDDLAQLSDKGKERLRERWTPQEGDVVVFWNETNPLKTDSRTLAINPNGHDCCYDTALDTNKELLTDYYPLPSIGQLIQFLDEHKYNWCYDAFENDGFTDDPNMVRVSDEELCDSLWMAVKDILEKE